MMIRAALLVLCLSTPALADCPAPGRLPAKITFNSGAVVEPVARDGDVIRYRQTVVETGKVVEMTAQLGIFTLSALRDGEGAVFDWKTPLPGLADLVPGASFHAEAILTTPGFLPPRPFTTDLTVVGPEEITLAGCTFAALKVVVVNTEAGKNLGEITKWLDPATLVTLKSEVRQGTDMKAQEAVAVE